MEKRDDLKIIVSSATMDARRFQNFLTIKDETPAIISLEGRMFPVDVHYLNEPCENYVAKSIQAAMEIHRSVLYFANVQEPVGDILIFMTGRDEIEQVVGGLLDQSVR